MSPFWILLELRVMEAVSDNNWSYKTCKAKLQPNRRHQLPTNQHLALYRPDAFPVAQVSDLIWDLVNPRLFNSTLLPMEWRTFTDRDNGVGHTVLPRNFFPEIFLLNVVFCAYWVFLKKAYMHNNNNNMSHWSVNIHCESQPLNSCRNSIPIFKLIFEILSLGSNKRARLSTSLKLEPRRRRRRRVDLPVRRVLIVEWRGVMDVATRDWLTTSAAVVKVVLWSRGGSPDEARLEQTPYPFQPH